MPERQPCRCLLKDSWPDMAASVAEVIDMLPPELRMPEDGYRARLAQCLACKWLRDGTCAMCGCYV